ncbi:penicillin-binding protein activator [Vibrio sp. JC009]|uniref:penicillin-binding protein activator n=1 Tax=Vibrio sp. JC009 TaxID=2912314 RepID=UPI0023B08CD1|nr:penicillin-binding protein activator [Vibrio sp. JC009]WED21447.1 penicillin-binding protein activator [Vibrio sp. JC009]
MAKKNHQQISVSRILTPVALAITLAACSSKPPAPDSVDITSAPDQSVQAYIIKADRSQGEIQSDWLIMALKAAILDGDTEQASRIIARLEKQFLTTEQRAAWMLLRAENNLMLERPELVLEQLNFEPWWQLTDAQWRSYHYMRADAFENTGDYYHAVEELNWLFNLPLEVTEEPVAEDAEVEQIPAEPEITQETEELTAETEQALEAEPLPEPREGYDLISDRIWENLSQLLPSELKGYAGEAEEWVMQGWLELALEAQRYSGNVPKLKSAIEAFIQSKPGHPAAMFVPAAIQEILDLEIIQPKKTTLLLPLTGKFAKQAQLVRDGFLLAMLDDKARDEDAILSVIDTNRYSMEEIDAKLAEEQSDFIVGPLVKSNIEKMQQLQSQKAASTPMLALNLPNELDTSAGTCYLTLSPEQEVTQAAEYLTEKGFKYPLILAPQGPLGERVTDAFTTEWKKKNITDVEVALFGTKAQLQQTIDKVFGLKESQSRIVQMDNLLGIESENQARSRRDIDSVYIVAKRSELTLIKPFIDVAINPEAQPPKLFSNSMSNTGGKRQFEDLSGVIFSDIPLLLNEDQLLNAQLNDLWPDQSNAQKRLQALGMDAYDLIRELPKMKVVPGYQLSGQTGVLSLGEQCIIQREISWAEHDAPEE